MLDMRLNLWYSGLLLADLPLMCVCPRHGKSVRQGKSLCSRY